jgi:hypothetical protein
MKSFLHLLIGQKSSRSKKSHSLPLRLETLEDRIVPAFTFGGGPLLASTAIQAVYLGSDWSNTAKGNPNPASTSYFDGFNKYIVNSPFMDMLKKDGYNVGRGTFTPGVIDPLTLTQGNSNVFLTDAQIQSDLQAEISANAVQQPGANSLYVVYVEDNVPVATSGGATSINTFAGYHSMFVGTNSSGQSANIYYAVIPTPGGSVGNGYGALGVSKSQEMTIVVSHELAEAATDPNPGTGWYDNVNNGEVGDIVAGEYMFLHNYAMQRISDKNDQAMTPLGAGPIKAETFVLESNGNLYEHSSSGTKLIASGVASISNQGVGLQGRATIDYVDTSGNTFTYDDLNGAVSDGISSAKQIQDSQGTEYVLKTNGTLIEQIYNGVTGSFSNVTVATGVASFSAGTDKLGVCCVDYVTTAGAAYEYSASSGKHLIKSSGVASVAAGPQGQAGIVLTTGEADLWTEANNKTTLLVASGVKQLSLGTNAAGNLLVERLDTNGNLWEYDAGTSKPPTQINSNVASVSDARLGVVDAIMSNGTAQEHKGTTWTTIDSNTVTGVG